MESVIRVAEARDAHVVTSIYVESRSEGFGPLFPRGAFTPAVRRFEAEEPAGSA
jgi:hypothetical protein